MDQCPQIDRVGRLIGGELTREQRAEVLAHVQRCPDCKRQLARMGWLARTIGTALSSVDPGDSRHLTDLEVAAFATHNLPAAEARLLEIHVAQCSECARLVAIVRRSLDEYEEAFGEVQSGPAQQSRWRQFFADARGALSSPRTAVALVASALAFIGECVSLGLGLAYIGLCLRTRPAQYDAVPDVWPFHSVPVGPLRLAMVVGALFAAAVLLRLVAGVLYRSAVRQPSSAERGDRA